MATIKQTKKTTYKTRKSKGNPNRCSKCGRFLSKKK